MIFTSLPHHVHIEHVHCDYSVVACLSCKSGYLAVTCQFGGVVPLPKLPTASTALLPVNPQLMNNNLTMAPLLHTKFSHAQARDFSRLYTYIPHDLILEGQDNI